MNHLQNVKLWQKNLKFDFEVELWRKNCNSSEVNFLLIFEIAENFEIRVIDFLSI